MNHLHLQSSNSIPNFSELIRLARVALTDEEFAEFLARLLKQHQRKEAA